MTNHATEVIHLTEGYRARCSCRAESSICTYKWQAEDWTTRHQRLVERARTHLRTQPTLKACHAYYMEMAENTGVPTEQREQWRLLAEGLRPRIRSTEDDQPALFDVKPLIQQPYRKGSQ